MSRNYDNWERLVEATLRREEYRRLARADSLSSCSSSSSSFSELSSSSHLSDSPFLNSSRYGVPSISYPQIVLATLVFSDENLIKRGHSGDLFLGHFQQFPCPVVVKRLNSDQKSISLELDFLSRVSDHPRFVNLLGICLEKENFFFLVYKYLPKRDLSKSLLRYDVDGSSQSLDWFTRSKIAIGTAQGLAYLHHECDPPLVHGDVQASSILVDDNFEVRLGSLSKLCENSGTGSGRLYSLLTRMRPSGNPNATWANDVYCFGKVLLELVTGKLGISSFTNDTEKEWLETILPYISIYDKELVTNILDPSLIIGDDLLEEVWAMAIIARSCLNPKPSRRPLIRYILKALENPLKIVREEEHTSPATPKTTTSGGN